MKSIYFFRKIARDLRPPSLEILGLSGALREYIHGIIQFTHIRIDFNDALSGRSVNGQGVIVLYRIIQEALNNVIRHSEATKVEIDLSSHENGIKLSIYDNGKGFNLKKVLHAPFGKKMGIMGMRENIELLGGRFDIRSKPKQGTEINVTLPNGKEYQS
jgi:signal transduction histidine kinase